jgi:hypothetical protein
MSRRSLLTGAAVVLVAISGAVVSQWSTSSSSTAASAVDEGALPDHTTVFADLPGIARLDPVLLGALRTAAAAATRDGVELVVESGWRSPQRQKQLLDEAVVEYGSAEAAARWVAPPDRSPHVAGSAIDVGSPDASAWLARHGAAYGLCRIYGNEPWHFERRADAGVHGCPPVYADAADDPRMRP